MSPNSTDAAIAALIREWQGFVKPHHDCDCWGHEAEAQLLRRILALVAEEVEAEREACAKITDYGYGVEARGIGKAIRARAPRGGGK